MEKSIIYYTDNRIEEPVKSIAQRLIHSSGLPIVSTSLEPIDFGKNFVIKGERGYITYTKQILTALENSRGRYIFFCEHDCLYPSSHFDFTPSRDDVYYYNDNVWRWYYGNTTAITYDRLMSLSSLCCNRELAISYYSLRLQKIHEVGLDQFMSNEPKQARVWGYEPGTKKIKRGGLTDDDYETWKSEDPIIDIRHRGTFSPPKVKLADFKHPPVNWREIPVADIPGWNLLSIFNLCPN